MNLDIEDLERKEDELEAKYDSVKKEAADLKQKYKNITEYLGIDAEREVSKEQRKVNGRIK